MSEEFKKDLEELLKKHNIKTIHEDMKQEKTCCEEVFGWIYLEANIAERMSIFIIDKEW